jgi:soluble lytic murein transglycosylase-like protein
VTAGRDPARALAAAAYAAGHAAGQQQPAWWRRLGDVVRGIALGVLLAAWWPSAPAQVPPVAEQYRRDLVRIAQSVWGLDAPIALLAAQIHQESGWRPDAVSSAGASGLAQFMPATARDVASRYAIGPPNAFDARWAMHAQSIYLRELRGLVRSAVDDSERIAYALSAYNGGLGHVRRRQALSPDPSRCIGVTCDIRPPGVSAASQAENREYPRRILIALMPRYYAAGWGGPALHARYVGFER